MTTGVDERPRELPRPSAPMLRTSRAGSSRAGVTISALVVLGMAAVVLVVLAMRPAGTRSEHFVRTFSDPNGYANSVSAPAAVTTRREVAGTTHRILTMKGGWTSDIGLDIVARAERWLGTPYSWDGGGYTGPSLGTPDGTPASRNDGHIVGFDCSGLVMYALAPYEKLTHYAATQYVQAGEVHPALNQLLPGDLVFWSSDGTIKGVHHVAIYIGNGNVVQAPHSGDVVRITPLNQVSGGAIGTTRPLTQL